MAITQVYATSVTCEHPVPEGVDPCSSRLLGDPDLTDDAARVAVAERGWDGGRLLCPKHR